MKQIFFLTAAAMLVACATAQDYGNVMQVDSNQYNIISVGGSEYEARQNALKAAKLACKEAGFDNGYIVKAQEVKYTGIFMDAQQQKNVTRMMEVANVLLSASKADKKPAPGSGAQPQAHIGHTKIDTDSMEDSIKEDSFEGRLTIQCQP